MEWILLYFYTPSIFLPKAYRFCWACYSYKNKRLPLWNVSYPLTPPLEPLIYTPQMLIRSLNDLNFTVCYSNNAKINDTKRQTKKNLQSKGTIFCNVWLPLYKEFLTTLMACKKKEKCWCSFIWMTTVYSMTRKKAWIQNMSEKLINKQNCKTSSCTLLMYFLLHASGNGLLFHGE